MLFTELIISQAKTVGVMAAAGVLVESLWQLKVYVRNRITVSKYVLDMIFWILAAAIVSTFLYYSNYGKLSLHALLGFVVGLLLWKLFLNKALKFTLL